VVFFLTLQLFPKESDKRIRLRLLTPRAAGEKKAPCLSLSGLAGLFTPLNKLLKLKARKARTEGVLKSAASSLTAEQFFAVKELCAIFAPGIYVIFVGLANVQPIWLVGLAGLGFVLPDIWLRKKIATRQKAIAMALPNAINLLNLAVGAGLDFMVAIKKMVEWSEPGPLIDELHQVWQETNMGATRRNALRNMARRINAPEVTSFVRTLTHAERMGTGVEEALRMQAEDALNLRFQRAERQALKAPIKMLFPLLVFILPVVLIIVAGPIVLQFLQGGFGMR